MSVPHSRLLLFVAFFICALPLLRMHLPPVTALLVAFDLSAGLFVVLTLRSLVRADARVLRASAENNATGRALALFASGLVAWVVLTLVSAEATTRSHPGNSFLVLSVVTLVLTWMFTNVAFAVHYTHLYYDANCKGNDAGGLEIPGDMQPDFVDLLYFAFTIGMTFQVSDIQVTDRRMRQSVLVHALVAFVFNIGVVAITISLITNAM